MDKIIEQCASYVLQEKDFPETIYQTVAYCLLDALGCSALALQYEACTKLLGPICSGTKVPKGVRVPGTKFILDPVKAAFDLGISIRWLDYNDTFLAKEWGHPSDNLGAILACCDYVAQREQEYQVSITLKTVLNYLIKAYEIQGCLSLENSFNAVGIDHVVFVKVASAAVAAAILGGDLEQVQAAISQAWMDGQSLRAYRHYPNTGSRKSWAAGDATARGVQLAWITMLGEPGYATPLSAAKWGVQDVLFNRQEIKINRNLDSYVVDNILFKVSFPAEFHAQTAVECAFILHEQYQDKLSQIEKINIYTQEPALRIISKQGKLHNPADRDHCLEYMIAVSLLFGNLTAEYYEDEIANNPMIDNLRSKMQVVEDERYTSLYYDAEKRAIPNAIQLFLKDGECSKKVEVIYPLGHKFRRAEAVPLVIKKAKDNLSNCYLEKNIDELILLLKSSSNNLNCLFKNFYNILF